MELSDLVNFHIETNKLKTTIRYGSCKKSMQESTADHSWKLALFVLDTIEKLKIQVDPIYSVKIALTHDLCEYQELEDIDSLKVAKGEVLKKDKHKIEKKIVEELAKKYERQDIYDAWIDFENTQTKEAKFVKAMDKLETLVHMTERGECEKNYDDADHIALYADNAVKNFPKFKPLLREIKSRLKVMYEKQSIPWKPEYDKV